MTRHLAALILLLIAFSGTFAYANPATLTPVILDTKPHLEGTFTQGLTFENGELTETSGLYGKSYVVRYNVENNRVAQKMTLPRTYFAEGITQVGNKLYMLTWKEEKLFVLRAYSFEFVETLSYSGEGWGITHDGTHFITSDGSSNLVFRDFNSFTPVRAVSVYEGAKRWDKLNELEFAHGLVWANVWHTPVILAIDPATGEVVGKADLSELTSENNHSPGKSVLNGIAYDDSSNAFWVTGKLWPNRYLIHFIWHKPMVAPKLDTPMPEPSKGTVPPSPSPGSAAP